MSTRANIKFSDKWDNYYIDRSHDGFPDNILPDIKETILSNPIDPETAIKKRFKI